MTFKHLLKKINDEIRFQKETQGNEIRGYTIVGVDLASEEDQTVYFDYNHETKTVIIHD